jgi:hypothetical protein
MSKQGLYSAVTLIFFALASLSWGQYNFQLSGYPVDVTDSTASLNGYGCDTNNCWVSFDGNAPSIR